MLTPEQKAARKTGIGGTDVAAILGLSPWKTPLDVYLEKTTEVPDIEATLKMDFGNIFERSILEAYTRKTGITVTYPKETILSQTRPYFRANVDGIGSDGSVLDAKNTSRRNDWGPEGSAEMPLHYLLQIAFYVHVLDAPEGRMIPFFGGDDLRVYVYKRDMELELKMVEKLDNFWLGHVVTRTPPDPTNLGDVVKLFPKVAKGTFQTADDITFAQIQELKQVRADISALQNTEDTLKSSIALKIRDADYLVYQDKDLASFSTQDTTRLNLKLLREEMPDIAKKYEYTTSTRVLRILK